ADDQCLQGGGQELAFEVGADPDGVHGAGQIAPLQRVVEVALEAAARQGREHLEGAGEDDVRDRLPAPARDGLRRLFQAPGQVEEQRLESILLGALRLVVEGPYLRTGRPDRDGIGDDLRRLAAVVAGAGESRGEDVLARLPPKLKVFTGAGRL